MKYILSVLVTLVSEENLAFCGELVVLCFVFKMEIYGLFGFFPFRKKEECIMH